MRYSYCEEHDEVYRAYCEYCAKKSRELDELYNMGVLYEGEV